MPFKLLILVQHIIKAFLWSLEWLNFLHELSIDGVNKHVCICEYAYKPVLIWIQIITLLQFFHWDWITTLHILQKLLFLPVNLISDVCLNDETRLVRWLRHELIKCWLEGVSLFAAIESKMTLAELLGIPFHLSNYYN